MPKSRISPNPHNCERCRQPVRQGSDFLRASLWGRCSWWHWSCFIRQMREHDPRSAESLFSGINSQNFNQWFPGWVPLPPDSTVSVAMPLASTVLTTYGQALANTFAALRAGVSCVDASAGGLGGCPYAESATGNLATEDLVWMLEGLGVEHGVDLGSLAATSVWLAGQLGRPSPSRVVAALAG